MPSVKRRYNYEVVLDVTKDEYQQQLANIITNFDTVYCTHDKDIYDDDVLDELGTVIHHSGDLKYRHTHFIIKMQYAKSISAVSKIIECKETDINYIKNMNSALKYLIHYKDDEKYNYNVSEVQFNNESLYSRFRKLVTGEEDEEAAVQMLIDYIASYNGILPMYIFMCYVNTVHLYKFYKRSPSTFHKMIDEHNNNYKKFGI